MQFTKISILRRKLAAIAEAVFIDRMPISRWETRHAVFFGEGRYSATVTDPVVNPGCRWECRDDFTRWFSAEVTVPESFSGKPLALELSFGGEGMLRVDGEIVSGLTTYLDDPFFRTRVPLSESAEAGKTYAVEAEMHTNYQEFNRLRQTGSTSVTYTFHHAELVTLDRIAESYYYDLKTAILTLEALEAPLQKIMQGGSRLPDGMQAFLDQAGRDPYFYEAAAHAVTASVTELDLDLGRAALLSSIPRAAETLKNGFAAISGRGHTRILFTGQSHIDTAWLWPVRESERKSAQTFANVLALLDRYPEFVFSFSQPQLYKFVKENYPALYERIKAYVAEGRIEPVGNTWVEMDTNIPSGESLVRQILYGRKFFMEEFGKCSEIFWMPDVFGYSWALPQIIRRSGMKYFFTSKLINNDDNRFPYSLFRWEGIDGTRIPAYLQRLNYNGKMEPSTLLSLSQRYDQKALLDECLMTFGYGDGGGGPTADMLETASRMKELPGLPRMELSDAQTFFSDADTVSESLPVWNDEMYYEFHRGTYSSQANTKKNNRRCELLFRRLEMENVFAHRETGCRYPADRILPLYQDFLTNQFHDIIPGSSIGPVYQDADRTYASAMRQGQDLFDEAAAALDSVIAHGPDTVICRNFLSWERTGAAAVSLQGTRFDYSPAVEVVDSAGNIIPSARSGNTLRFAAKVPPMGYACFTLREGHLVSASAVHVEKRLMENAFWRIRLDENALFVSLYDKRAGREVLAGPSARLLVFEDKPGGETAWNIDLEYQNKCWPLDSADSIEPVEENSVRGVLRVQRHFHDSVIIQDIILYADNDRIDFRTRVNWQETEKMLKAEFLPDVRSSRAAYEIQFGTIERPTHWNTSRDRTRFEVPAHKWADLSEGAYGISLLNDCKYGYDIHESRMRLTLLRAPVDPDKNADRGKHTFTYSLRPHSGNWVQACVWQTGYELNVPLECTFLPDANPAGSLPAFRSWVTCSAPNVVVDTIKRAEDGSGTIVRVYEASGTKTNVTLHTEFGTKAAECNLMEERETELSAPNGDLTFTIRPFEIRTFLFSRLLNELRK